LLEFTGTLFNAKKYNDTAHLNNIKIPKTEREQSIP